MDDNKDKTREVMEALFSAICKEMEKEQISSSRVTALAQAISALTPLVQSNW